MMMMMMMADELMDRELGDEWGERVNEERKIR